MKAVILCAGAGTRLLPLTATRAKVLVPVANRPLLGHLLGMCDRLGLAEVILVLHPSMEDAADQARRLADGVRVDVAYQEQPRGLADAVRAAAPLLTDDEPFVVILGDLLLSPDAELTIRDRLARRAPCLFLAPVERPQAYGVVELAGGRVAALEEKPARPRSDLAIVGVYLLPPALLPAIEALQPSPRGELELTDAIAALVHDGVRIAGELLPTDGWLDTGTLEGLLHANRCLTAAGPAVAPTALVERARLEGGIAIGDACRVRDATLRDCILLDGTVVEGPAPDGAHPPGLILERVVLGAGARVTGAPGAVLRNQIIGDGDELVVDAAPIERS